MTGLERDRWTTPVHVEPLLDLASKVHPAHTALVVIDMQNDFCADAGMMARDGNDLSAVQAMAERLPDLLEAARAVNCLVVFVRNVYNTETNWYLSDSWLEVASRRYAGETYTAHPACPPDSWNGDFYGRVRPQQSEPIVTKHRYSAFHATDLETILRAHGIRTLIMTGVATNVCVETTAREGFVRDYYIVFPADGTAAYSRQAHEMTLQNIALHFGEVTRIDELIKTWKDHVPERATAAPSAAPSVTTQHSEERT